MIVVDPRAQKSPREAGRVQGFMLMKYSAKGKPIKAAMTAA